MTDEDWADDHGYQRYRDPLTGRTFWTDGDPAAECGEGREEDEKEEETMETIGEQRYKLRRVASDAMEALQDFELQMLAALVKIREALGLAKDAQPEQIAEAVRKEKANGNKAIAVLAENGLSGLSGADGVRALAGRAQTALADQKILADRNVSLVEQRDILASRNVAVSAENVKLVTELEELKRRLAEVEKKNLQFAWELEFEKCKQAPKTTPTPGYEQACKPQWRRSPGGDVGYSRVGPLSCWYRPDVGLRWTHKDWRPEAPWTSLELPGYSAVQVMEMRQDQKAA